MKKWMIAVMVSTSIWIVNWVDGFDQKKCYIPVRRPTVLPKR